MKKFSKITENKDNQKYFQITAEVTLIVKSETEGEAGYLADSILGSIKEQSDFKVQDILELTDEEYLKQFESYNIGQNQSWIENDGFLQKSFQFKDFKEALDFINKVGKISESMNHHPEITNVYNKVTLKLKTHDKNQITDLDYKMAEKVDQLFNI
jgi:4a-hydroxytetrahydrobiopterin dehydratase